MTQVGDFLLLLALVLAAILVGVQCYRALIVADVWSWDEFGKIAQYVLVLLIASIPVALPAVMSVTMAIGAYTLSLQRAIVSRLSAIEELAGVDVLCSDKTGTLTMNQLTVEKQIPFGSFSADDVLRDAALATQKSSDDAIDVAVLSAAGSRVDFAQVKQTDFVPFDPVNKRTVATIVDAAGKIAPLRQGRAAGDHGTWPSRMPTWPPAIRPPSPNSPAKAIARSASASRMTARPGALSGSSR